MHRILFAFIFSLSLALSAQECQYLETETEVLAQEHVNFLASDELAGRAPGTDGIAQAKDYIAEHFSEFGLTPAFEEGFTQELTVPRSVEKTARFRLGDREYKSDEFYPVKYSGNGDVSGNTEYVEFAIESDKLKRDDIDDEALKGALAVMEIGSPDGIHPHSKFKAFHDIFTRLETLKKKGAKGVILIDSKEQTQNPQREFKTLNAVGFPVIFVSDNKVAQKLKKGGKAQVKTSLKAISDKTYNIAGMIDNGAPQTIIIGAHYDHLGRGKEGSLHRGEENEIHNGADDNASGTAGLLLLANFLNTTENAAFRRHNFLLVAFTAEEMGLLGSSYFVKNYGQEDERYFYMFNMDMIGRMEEQKLQVNGVGTSPLWPEIFEGLGCDLEYVFSESGVGPSDHTSFYYKNTPVLHFFTGTHTDYHKPSDDAGKINSEGIVAVLNTMLGIIAASPQNDFPFSETKNESGKAPSFFVTLGVLPDYLYTGNGMKIDGVTEGKPAHKAGLEEGDIVTKLGNVTVSDMRSYMKALGQFEAGDKTKLEYKRNGEIYKTTVQF